MSEKVVINAFIVPVKTIRERIRNKNLYRNPLLNTTPLACNYKFNNLYLFGYIYYSYETKTTTNFIPTNLTIKSHIKLRDIDNDEYKLILTEAQYKLIFDN